jgi:hypothetical protein
VADEVCKTDLRLAQEDGDWRVMRAGWRPVLSNCQGNTAAAGRQQELS